MQHLVGHAPDGFGGMLGQAPSVRVHGGLYLMLQSEQLRSVRLFQVAVTGQPFEIFQRALHARLEVIGRTVRHVPRAWQKGPYGAVTRPPGRARALVRSVRG